MSIEYYYNAVRAALTDDLRLVKYRKNTNPKAGHCYIASEALWHLLGGPASTFRPSVIKVGGDTHWFLMNDIGIILDPTVDQFNEIPAYNKARRCGFLTNQPSKRAKIVISRVTG
jgi:hypothetical protein